MCSSHQHHDHDDEQHDGRHSETKPDCHAVSHGHEHAGVDSHAHHGHSHAHDHDHSHGHSHDHAHGHSHDHTHDHSHSHAHSHAQDPFLPDETPAEAHCVDHSCGASIDELKDEGDCGTACSTNSDHDGCCDAPDRVDSYHDADPKQTRADNHSPVQDPLRYRHVHKPCRKANCITRQKRRADRTMCDCCVKAMMGQEDVGFLRSLMDAAMQMHVAARRCCIAFASYCCPRPEECALLEQKCCPPDDELVPLLSDSPDYGTETKTETTETETFTLEISGMDCPDCLAKVRKAFDSLPGASIKKIDYIRGIVQVERDESAADAEIIGKFVSRASGFSIRVVYSSPSDGPRSSLVVKFDHLPPQHVLKKYDTGDIRDSEVVFLFHSQSQTSPREIMSQLAEYGPHLPPPGRSREESRINADVRALAIRTGLCALLTIPILIMVWAPVPHKGAIGYRAAEFALATGVFALAFPIYSGSFRTIWYLHQADLGVLTAVSTLTTYIFSIVAFAFQAAGHEIAEPFFETLGLLITLIYLGRTIQASTRKAALSAISSLAKLQPERADIVADGNVEQIDARLLFYGDTMRVSTGGVLPSDGVVFSGSADVDESAITGESVPVVRGPGQTVHAGTTVLGGSIDVAVSRLTGENSLASVIHAVMDAQSSNSAFSDLADRVASWLLPIASFSAIASFLVWLFVIHYVRGKPWGTSVLEAVTYAIAVMAVSCPCALTLAVPTISATVIAMGVKDGVVFRSSEALLSLSTIKSFAFDKTGTLSLGTLSIVEAFTGNGHDLTVQLVAHMTASNRHPVSVAVNQYLSTKGATPSFEIEYSSVPGGGIRGDFYGYPVLGGSAQFTGTSQHPLVQQYISSGYTVFVVTVGAKLVAAFGLSDKERDGSARVVSMLHTRAAVTILSGDHQAAVSAFARRIGDATAIGGLSPSGKAEAITKLQQSGKVAFVGDGVNDSIALSQADIGIGMGSGTDAAVLASSIVLLGTDLFRTMVAALDLAASARIHAMLALVWCGIYFTVAILLASGATVNARIPVQYAGLGEMVSVAPVILLAVSAWLWRGFQRRK